MRRFWTYFAFLFLVYSCGQSNTPPTTAATSTSTSSITNPTPNNISASYSQFSASVIAGTWATSSTWNNYKGKNLVFYFTKLSASNCQTYLGIFKICNQGGNYQADHNNYQNNWPTGSTISHPFGNTLSAIQNKLTWIVNNPLAPTPTQPGPTQVSQTMWAIPTSEGIYYLDNSYPMIANPMAFSKTDGTGFNFYSWVTY